MCIPSLNSQACMTLHNKLQNLQLPLCCPTGRRQLLRPLTDSCYSPRSYSLIGFRKSSVIKLDILVPHKDSSTLGLSSPTLEMN